MAKNERLRPIRFDQFEKQLEEVGINNVQEVQMTKEVSVYIRLGNSIDAEDTDDFELRMADAGDSEEVAKIVLDYYPETTDPDEFEPLERGEKQWEIFKEHGGTADKMAALWAASTAEQRERLGKLRPKR